MEQKQERLWAMLCHLTALVGFVGVPFGNILGPLVVWLVKKGESPVVDQNGKESLNFQITVAIAGIIAGILTFIIIGIPLLIAIVVADLVFVIIATVKTNNGESYQYPFSLKLIK